MADKGYGMDKADLKTLIKKTEGAEAFGCALGKGKTGPYILIHKTKTGVQLMPELKSEFSDVGTNVIHGEVQLVEEEGKRFVRFSMNKPVSGLEILVTKLIKTDAGVPDSVFVYKEPADAAPGAPVLDAEAIKQRLSLLVQQMIKVIGANPTLKDSLSAIARQANGALGSAALAEATLHCDELEAALANVPQTATPGGAVPNAPPMPSEEAAAAAVAVAKSRNVWLAVHRKVATDIETLRRSILDEYEGTDVAAQLDKRYGEVVAPVLTRLDESLADALDQIRTARDAGERVKLVERAHEIMKGYESYVASEPLLAELDSNPFVPMAIAKTVTSTLRSLAVAVK